MTKRNFEKNENNIKDELNLIRETGKKFYGKYKDYTPKFIKLKSVIKKILKTFFLDRFFYFVGKTLISIGNKFISLK